ncbi:hypothetical protein ABPG75_005085 [Micractinium tetrahymenae]
MRASMTADQAVSDGEDPAAGRLRFPLGLMLNLILLVAPQLGLHGHLGSLWLNSVIAAGGLLLVCKLASFPRRRDEMRHAPSCGAGELLHLGTSASDRRKYAYVPLQDNAEIGLLWLFQRYLLLRGLVLGWRVDMHFLLYAFVALCLSVAWDQVPYSGFGMGTRFMETIAWTHLIWTLAFMTTVLPNPRPGCYARSFPPVPADWREFVAIGFSAKRGSGCNDLVVSGHGVVYAAVPLALSTFYPLPAWRGDAAAVAWLAVLKLCLQETVDKTHYSVDMLLAVVLTALVWHWRSPAYPASAVLPARSRGSPKDPLPWGLVALVVGVLVVVFVGVAGT